MDDWRGYQKLLREVLRLAIQDRKSKSARYQQDAMAFFQSQGFVWVCEAIANEALDPYLLAVGRDRILSSQVRVSRHAYH